MEPPGTILFQIYWLREGTFQHIPQEVCLAGREAANFSIKGQTVSLLGFTGHIQSLSQILFCLLCVCFGFWTTLKNRQTIFSSQTIQTQPQTRINPKAIICQPLAKTKREKVSSPPDFHRQKADRDLLSGQNLTSDGKRRMAPKGTNWS